MHGSSFRPRTQAVTATYADGFESSRWSSSAGVRQSTLNGCGLSNSAFGQTQWPLAQQAKFLSGAVCDPRNSPVIDLNGTDHGGPSAGGSAPSPTHNSRLGAPRPAGRICAPNRLRRNTFRACGRCTGCNTRIRKLRRRHGRTHRRRRMARSAHRRAIARIGPCSAD